MLGVLFSVVPEECRWVLLFLSPFGLESGWDRNPPGYRYFFEGGSLKRWSSRADAIEGIRQRLAAPFSFLFLGVDLASDCVGSLFSDS